MRLIVEIIGFPRNLSQHVGGFVITQCRLDEICPIEYAAMNEFAAEILDGVNGTIQVDAYGAYTHLATPKRPGGDPLRLAFCWAHGRRKLIKAKPRKESPIVDEALLRRCCATKAARL